MLKRGFDLIVVLMALPLIAPVFLIVAALVRVKLGAPVFFRQTRAGRGGRPFEMVKFRSMRDENGPDGRPLPDALRLTPFGRALRSTSLDELPELWNVVKGEMSLVGPRPLLMSYLERYTPEEARRHEVPPGLTGLAQVKGRNAVSWEERLRWDVHYVDHHGLWVDLQILFATVWQVLRREGISAAGEATMTEFRPPQRADGAVQPPSSR